MDEPYCTVQLVTNDLVERAAVPLDEVFLDEFRARLTKLGFRLVTEPEIVWTELTEATIEDHKAVLTLAGYPADLRDGWQAGDWLVTIAADVELNLPADL